MSAVDLPDLVVCSSDKISSRSWQDLTVLMQDQEDLSTSSLFQRDREDLPSVPNLPGLMQTNEISGQLSLAGSGSPASLKTHFGRE